MTTLIPGVPDPDRYPEYNGDRPFCSGMDGCGVYIVDSDTHFDWHRSLDEFCARVISELADITAGAKSYESIHRGDQPPYSPKGTDDPNSPEATLGTVDQGSGVAAPPGDLEPRGD